MLNINDIIPLDIEILDINKNKVNLRNYLGKYLVIYFYPKDETPGCTTEACEFRDYYDKMKKLGAEIIGISKDNSNSHNSFKEKYNLNFTLLSDEDHKLQEAFGVWSEMSMYGKKYFGTERSSFLVNKEGKIIFVWPKVNPNGHAEDVYNKLIEAVNSKN